jgi:hypothetical protein
MLLSAISPFPQGCTITPLFEIRKIISGPSPARAPRAVLLTIGLLEPNMATVFILQNPDSRCKDAEGLKR